MEVIKINSAADVEDAYKGAKVSKTRVDSLNDKFQTVPDEFTIYGLCFPTLKIAGEEVPNVPAFAISEDGKKYIPVGTFKQSYTDKNSASEITKEGKNKGKFLITQRTLVPSMYNRI